MGENILFASLDLVYSIITQVTIEPKIDTRFSRKGHQDRVPLPTAPLPSTNALDNKGTQNKERISTNMIQPIHTYLRYWSKMKCDACDGLPSLPCWVYATQIHESQSHRTHVPTMHAPIHPPYPPTHCNNS